jgi:hypothetical protein
MNMLSQQGTDCAPLGLAFESANFKTEVKYFDADSEFATMKRNMNSQVGARGKNGGKGLNHFGSSAGGVFSIGKTAKCTLDGATQLSVSDFSFKVGFAEEVKVLAMQQAILRCLAKEIKAHLSADAVNLTKRLLKDLNKRAAGACIHNF